MNNAVKDVMTIRVVSVKRGTSFKEMAAALRENRVSAFPVIDDDGKVIGVVSEADMLARKVLSTGMLRRGEQEKAAALGHVIVRKVRHVQGVVAVRDRLSYADAYPPSPTGSSDPARGRLP